MRWGGDATVCSEVWRAATHTHLQQRDRQRRDEEESDHELVDEGRVVGADGAHLRSARRGRGWVSSSEPRRGPIAPSALDDSSRLVAATAARRCSHRRAERRQRHLRRQADEEDEEEEVAVFAPLVVDAPAGAGGGRRRRRRWVEIAVGAADPAAHLAVAAARRAHDERLLLRVQRRRTEGRLDLGRARAPGCLHGRCGRQVRVRFRPWCLGAYGWQVCEVWVVV